MGTWFYTSVFDLILRCGFCTQKQMQPCSEGEGFKRTKRVDKSYMCQQRKVCCFTKRFSYDILIKKKKKKETDPVSINQ